MATRGGLFFMLLLFLSYVTSTKPYDGTAKDITSTFVVSKLDIRLYPSRNSGLPRRSTTTSVPPCQKAKRGIYLVKLSMCAGYLLLLADDVSLNSRPSTGTGNAQMCPSCCKVIRRNQTRLQCKLCDLNCHLKCLGADHDLNGYCQGCSAQQSTDENSDITTGEYEYLPSNLRDIMKLRGFKIVHQNIQSLRSKIDQLRLILHELKGILQPKNKCCLDERS